MLETIWLKSLEFDHMTIHHRLDYRPFGWTIHQVALCFDLDAESTLVHSRMQLSRTCESSLQSNKRADFSAISNDKNKLVLDGEDLELESILVDGQQLDSHRYHIKNNQLTIENLPDHFHLETLVRIKPAKNTSLSGLYQSGQNLLTQCEAQGFRRISFFPDRPDVMTRYSVRLRADPKRYPVLLANGNCLSSTMLDDGRLETRWEDPFPKPSYLFAIVAGTLVANEAMIKTASGKNALLQVWVEPGNEDKTDWCMASLQRALRWDEARFELELDLERFMIVATEDFNMGAMENKGLNIFNTKYVFAHPRMATDADFAAVESVVGHEYFHNWTGNRITCRDWFQLTLKEGLTVFRDQEFSADLAAEANAGLGEAALRSARAVQRIAQIRTLKALQFPEDAGPMAHAIRPDTYSAIDNFYTMTVYEKGAEVVRMLQTILTPQGFRRGMDRYIKMYDGQAVTCDDFLDAMSQANQRSLDSFRSWYSTPGTPILVCNQRCEGEDLILRIQQQPPQLRSPQVVSATQPLLIPVLIGFDEELDTELWEIDQWDQERRFSGRAGASPSLLRGFSAPVMLHDDLSVEQIARLASCDGDPVNRWMMMQRLMSAAILGLGSEAPVIEALAIVLNDKTLDPAFAALMLSFPPELELAQAVPLLDPQALRLQRNRLIGRCAKALKGLLANTVRALRLVEVSRTYEPNHRQAGERALSNAALLLWSFDDSPESQSEVIAVAQSQCSPQAHMTDRAAGMSVLMRQIKPIRDRALESFEEQFKDEALAMDRWLMMQATRQRLEGEPPVLDDLIALCDHNCFSMRNPNKVRALISSFCHSNLAEFHEPTGKSYAWFEKQFLALDAINPQVAARLGRAMDRWPTLIEPTRSLAQACLERLRAHQPLSPDSAEIISRSLENQA